MSPPDISVSFPSAGVIRVRSDSLFGNVEGPACRRFIERVFVSKVIASISITGADAPRADLCYCPRTFALPYVVRRLGDLERVYVIGDSWIDGAAAAQAGARFIAYRRAATDFADRGVVPWRSIGHLSELLTLDFST